MNITLHNKLCAVSFNSFGAEMTSFQFIDESIEYIWQANPAVWNRHAPVLFPIIGTLKDHEYSLNDNLYKITPHGFARDAEFQVIAQSETHIVFRLTNTMLNKEQFEMYPFPFQLDIEYHLEGSRISKKHTVTNTGNNILYYQLGGHDAYAVSLLDGETMGDYYLDFYRDISEIKMLRLHPVSKAVTKDIRVHTLDHGTLSVPMTRFHGDTLIIDQPDFHKVALRSRKSNRSVEFSFDHNFNVLAFWSKNMGDIDSNFVCIEPWSCLPDCHYVGKALEEKVYIQTLQPKESKEYVFTSTFNK